MLLIQSFPPVVSVLMLTLLLSSMNVMAKTPSATSKIESTTSTSSVELVSSTNKLLQSPANYSAFGGANTQEDSDDMWQALKEQYFSDRFIIEDGNNRIRLKAPGRAENDALVPVLINIETNDTDSDPFIKVYLIVDVNPLPMGGIFKLAENRPMKQLKTSVRVNGYTYIRAVGETASGILYMSKKWVKSTGAGCSAPPGLDQDMHKKRLGKMRFKHIATKNNNKSSRLFRLMISHPNNTGMQRDQLTTLFIPEHYVKHVNVTFNKDPVLEADINFTLSENPNFTFSFDPEESGILRAKLTDNLDNSFGLETEIKGHRE